MTSEIEHQDQAGEIVDAEVIAPETPWLKFIPWAQGVEGFYAQAETVDQLLDDVPEVVKLLTMTGKPITVHGATLHDGTLTGKKTVYVVMDLTTNSSGKRIAATTGAGAVMRQLSRACELDLFPFEAMAYQVSLGKKGRTDPLHLGKVDRF